MGKPSFNRIFLVGFMGSGKSTIGKEIARLLQFEFRDTDKMIEQRMGKSIGNIFAEEGEVFFRKKEHETVLDLLGCENMVVSTGGGLPCFYDNMKIMNGAGITLYLQASPKLLAHRLKESKTERPLLRSVSGEELNDVITVMLRKREPFYEQARFKFSIYNLKAEDILHAIRKGMV